MGFFESSQRLTDLERKVRDLCGSFCCKVETCLGISPTADTSLVLNKRGEWIANGSGGFSCSSLNSCTADSLPNGTSNVYFTGARVNNWLGISDGGDPTLFLNQQGDFVAGGGTPSGTPTQIAYFDANTGLLTSDVNAVRDTANFGNTSIKATDGTNFASTIQVGDTNIGSGTLLTYQNLNDTTISGIQATGNNLSIYNNSVVWNWPTADGTNGQVLTTDGGGVLTWGAGSGGAFLPLAGGTMDPGAQIFFGTGGQNIAQGSFDNGTGGNQGISLYCTVNYELNWQGGHLSNYSGGYQPLTIDSPIILSPSTNFSTGWGNVQEIITSSGTESGISFTNTSVDGRQWNIISTGTGSGVPIGSFSIGDASASANRFMIDSSGVVSILNLAGGGNGLVGVDNTGQLFFTTPATTPTLSQVLTVGNTNTSIPILGDTFLRVNASNVPILQNIPNQTMIGNDNGANGDGNVYLQGYDSTNVAAGLISFGTTSGLPIITGATTVLDLAGNGDVIVTSDNNGLLGHIDAANSFWKINGNTNTGGYIGTNDANDFYIKTNGLEAMRVLATNQFVAIGNTSPVSLFSVGSGNQFQIDTNGNILFINNVATSFPSSQGAASTFLQNDGTGSLTWATTPSTLIGSTSGIASQPTAGATTETFLGSGAGAGGASTTGTAFLGMNAGFGAVAADLSTYIGSGAGSGSTETGSSVYIGHNAGINSSSTNTIFIGSACGNNINTGGNNSIFIGSTGFTAEGNNSILIANSSSSTGGFDNTIVLGNNATATVSNQLVIADATTALHLQLNSGVSGRVLTVNSTGDASWKPLNSIRVTSISNTNSPYSIMPTDYLISVDTTTGTVTVFLPGPPTSGDVYIIKDVNGTSLINNITVNGNGNNIDGTATKVININFQSLTIVFTGVQWSVI